MKASIIVILCVAFVLAPRVSRGSIRSMLQNATEIVTKKTVKKGVKAGAEQVGESVTRLAAKHGDDLVNKVLHHVGPKGVKLAEAAGDEAGIALRMLARHGDGAMGMAGRTSARKLVSQFGDDAADVIVRHGEVGERIVGQFAEPGVKALMSVGSDGARRMAIMAEGGVLSTQLMDVIATGGEKACSFIWENKAGLAVGATLTAFLASPETFIEGGVSLANGMAEHVAEPVIEGIISPVVGVPVEFAKVVAYGTNWTVIVLAGLIGVLAAAWYSRATKRGLAIFGLDAVQWLRNRLRRPLRKET